MKKSNLPFFIPNSGNETEPLACLEDGGVEFVLELRLWDGLRFGTYFAFI